MPPKPKPKPKKNTGYASKDKEDKPKKEKKVRADVKLDLWGDTAAVHFTNQNLNSHHTKDSTCCVDHHMGGAIKRACCARVQLKYAIDRISCRAPC